MRFHAVQAPEDGVSYLAPLDRQDTQRDQKRGRPIASGILAFTAA
jgi:hypothetical protein